MTTVLAEVALFEAEDAGGGIARSLGNLARGLGERGLRVDRLLARREDHHGAAMPGNVRTIVLDAGRAARSVGPLARYLRSERPQALLAGSAIGNVIATAASQMARSRARLALGVRTHARLDRAGSRRAGVRLAYRLAPLACRRADRIIAVSHGVAEEAASAFRIDPRRIDVVYNPIVGPHIAEQAAEPVGHPWLDQPGPPVLLSIGRLSRQKDQATLLRAFAQLRRQRPARLIILGEGVLEGELKRLAGLLDVGAHVDFAGFRPNPYPYLKHAAAFVLSSRWEGFGNVLAEALACGTPVVSTDCPCGPSEILDGGRFGELTPVGDADALARAMACVLDGPRDARRLQRRAQCFSLSRAAAAYERLLLE